MLKIVFKVYNIKKAKVSKHLNDYKYIHITFKLKNYQFIIVYIYFYIYKKQKTLLEAMKVL